MGNTSINSAQPEEEKTKNALNSGKVPSLSTRTRNGDNVDKFLITFPNRCPDGWIFEHDQCRRPFNDIGKPWIRSNTASNALDLGEIPIIRSRTRANQEDVENFLITFPNRC